MVIGTSWDDVWDDVWQSVWSDTAPAISDGDEVMVLAAPGGIACSVTIDAAVGVRVLAASAKQIHVLTTGGTPIKVTI